MGRDRSESEWVPAEAEAESRDVSSATVDPSIPSGARSGGADETSAVEGRDDGAEASILEVLSPTIRVEIPEDVDLDEGQIAEIVRSVAWQAPIPPPDILSQYPDWIQRSIEANARATSADESERQSKMVDAHISELHAESMRADKVTDHRIQQAVSVRKFVYAAFAACFIAAVVFFLLGDLVAGSIFLGITVLGFLGNLLVEVLRSKQGGGLQNE